MKRLLFVLVTLLGTALLAGCGPTHHVFPPQVSVQQVGVDADGQWNVTLRMQNYSYDAAVHFDHIHATLSVNGVPAATFDIDPDLDVAERSADVTEVTVQPDAAAHKALTASSRDQSATYALKGKVQVTGEDSSRQRDFPVDHHGWLSPVPGIANTYR